MLDRIDMVSWFKTTCQNNGNESTSVKCFSRKCKIWHEMNAAAVCGIPQIHAESYGSWTLDYSSFLKKKCVVRTYCTCNFSSFHAVNIENYS